jgi:hypothetical protein
MGARRDDSYKYFKAAAEGEQPSNLLSLPECPAKPPKPRGKLKQIKRGRSIKSREKVKRRMRGGFGCFQRRGAL